MTSPRNPFLGFLLKERLLLVSLAGLAGTSLFMERLPRLGWEDLEILFLLAVLFVTVKGLERSGAVARISRRMERGAFLPLKLVGLTFFLSMVVTNDVALVVLVPLTLALEVERKDLLVILEALAANAGSALTPLGNPQNLFIYWTFHVPPGAFLLAVAPFSLVFLLLFALASLGVPSGRTGRGEADLPGLDRKAWVHGGLLLLVVLAVIRVLPLEAGWAVLLYALLFDRRALRIDYALLATLLCFFGISENLKPLFHAPLERADQVFLFSALSSQVISNVPAAVLFGKFTTQWKALLWGVNVGGFGGLVGSLANLIAYKLYLGGSDGEGAAAFTARFLLLSYVCFFLGMGLYFLFHGGS